MMHLHIHPLLQPADRLLRPALHQNFLLYLQQLRHGIAQADAELIAPPLNQLALILAFRGQADISRELCHLSIILFKALAQRQRSWQIYAVQPWINLARLARWRQGGEHAIGLYREMHPQARRSMNRLQHDFDLPLLEELCNFDASIRALLDAVFWRELGQLYYALDRQQVLRQHLSQGLQTCGHQQKLALFELLLLSLAREGRCEAALRCLQKNRVAASGSLDDLCLQVLAQALQYALHPAAAQFASLQHMVLRQSQAWRSGAELNFLLAFCQLLQQLDVPDVLMWRRCRELALQLGDEVVAFEAGWRLMHLGELQRSALEGMFAASEYALIRRRLALPLGNPSLEMCGQALLAEMRQAIAHLSVGCVAALAAA